MLAACGDSTGPTTVTFEGRTPYPDVESLRAVWASVESCSHLLGDFDKVNFSQAREIRFNGRRAFAVWVPKHEIVVVEGASYRTIAHEMMHDLLQRADHPPLYFNDLCGDLTNIVVG